MLNLLIPILIFGWLLKSNYARKKLFSTPSSFILLLFFISFLFSVPYVYFLGYKELLIFDNIEPVLFFSTSLLLFLWGIYKYDETKITYIVLPNNFFLFVTSWIIGVLSLISVIYFFPIALKGLLLSNIEAARNEIRLTGVNYLVEDSLINTLASSISYFYQVAILFYFLSIITKQSKILTQVLFLSSLSYPLYVFAYLGRDGILFWFFSFYGLFIFFKKFMEPKQNYKINRIFLIASILGFIGFFIISLSRFGSTSNYEFGFIGSIIDYFGQTLSNFCALYNAKFSFMYGTYSFTYFVELLGFKQASYELYQYQLSKQKLPSWVWGTFLRSFYTDFGVIGVYILGIIWFFLFKIKFLMRKNNNFIDLANLVIYFWVIQFLFQGVFYFRQYTKGMNLNIVLTFILAYFFLVRTKHSKNRLIIKAIHKNVK
jgi:oligosaccharide repeat unit polymerase